VFTFQFNPDGEEDTTTKRQALQRVSKLFDPLGLVAPVIIAGRILLQRIWLAGTEWDELMPGELVKLFTTWVNDLKLLSDVSIPRCLSLSDAIARSELHVFTDASQDAYGAVVYCRHVYVRVANVVSSALSISTTTLWSDSLNVLFWLKNTSRSFKPFVANRVGEIHRLTQPSQWRHVPGTDNPADLVSRGVPARELSQQKLWWSGPSFLQQDESIISEPEQAEMKKSPAPPSAPPTSQSLLAQQTTSSTDIPWRLEPSRFSDWTTLVRRTAWVLRFVENCRLPAEARCKASLTADEIDDAERLIIRKAQVLAFTNEYESVKKGKEIPASSKLSSLTPFLDEDGVLRMRGRLEHAEFMSYDAQHPIILPRKGDVTELIVRHYHQMGGHSSGVNHTMTKHAGALLGHRWTRGDPGRRSDV